MPNGRSCLASHCETGPSSKEMWQKQTGPKFVTDGRLRIVLVSAASSRFLKHADATSSTDCKSEIAGLIQGGKRLGYLSSADGAFT